DEPIQAFNEEFPGLANSITIPADAYGTIDDVTSLGFWNQFSCPASMPEEAAYAATKAVFEHIDQLQQSVASARDTTVENNVKFLENSAIPYHDGAARYYKEVAAQ